MQDRELNRQWERESWSERAGCVAGIEGRERGKCNSGELVARIAIVSGIGRNGTFTVNLRFRFLCKIYFRDYSRTTSKLSDQNSHENPLVFKNF